MTNKKSLMINMLKTMVNSCEKFTNDLTTYHKFQSYFTDEEWDAFTDTLTEDELNLLQNLSDRFTNYLEIIYAEILNNFIKK